MIATNYTSARNNLKHYMDHARENCEPVIITGKSGNSVLMSEDEYNNLIENLYIRSNPELYAKILRGKEQLEKGSGVFKTLDELKTMESE